MSDRVLKRGTKVAGRYRIIRFIGEGGMQEVYKARDTELERDIALKVPKNETAKKRFQRSAVMSAKVTHPNVAKTLDYFPEGNREYLIEEFVEGDDLKFMLEEEFKLMDPHLAAHVFHHLAKGLAAVHRVGVFHRDLKPSNIMVSHDHNLTVVKITDFGIAKMAQEEIEEALKDEESMIGSETVVGAIPYMAPELIENPKTAKLSADIWSIGAILYHIIAGKRPYGDGLGAVKKILVAEPPTKPNLLQIKSQFKGISDDLWAVLLECMQKKPGDRPSANDLVKRCGELCYSTASRCEGTLTRYRSQGGNWGFINCSDDKSAFFHVASYYGRKPRVGERVSLARFPGTPRQRAFPVLPFREDQ